MQKPAHRSSRTAIVQAGTVAIGVVAIGFVAVTLWAQVRLGPPLPSRSPNVTVASSPTEAVIDPTTCLLAGVPDRPGPRGPGNGEGVDDADVGTGRWRICLSEPVAVELEGRARCTWSDDRTTVRDVSGLPLADAAGMVIDGGIALDEPSVALSLSPNPGAGVTTFGSRQGELVLDSVAAGRRGAASIRLRLSFSSEDPPVAQAPDRVGTIRWVCGEPPPHRPGRSTGQVALRLDAPIGGTWQVQAMCNWVTTPTGSRLGAVETYPPLIRYKEALIGILVGPNTERPDRVDVALWVDRTIAGDSYQPGETQIVVRQARDGSTGLVRLRHLEIDPSSEVRIADDVTDVSGVVSWTCPPPPVPGPLDDGGPAGEEPELRPGRARIMFTPEVGPPAEGPITCVIDRSNAPTLAVRELRGSIPAFGGRYELFSNGPRVVLGLVGPDGQPAGEYVGDALRFSDDPTKPDLALVVSPIEFEPTDPRYVPLGGPDGPRSLRLEIDYSCPV